MFLLIAKKASQLDWIGLWEFVCVCVCVCLCVIVSVKLWTKNSFQYKVNYKDETVAIVCKGIRLVDKSLKTFFNLLTILKFLRNFKFQIENMMPQIQPISSWDAKYKTPPI